MKSKLARLVFPLAVFLLAAYGYARPERAAAAGALVGLDPRIAAQSIGVLAWMAGGWTASCVLNDFLVGPYAARRSGGHAPAILLNLVTGLVLLLAALGAVRHVFDGNITGLLATSGVVTLVVGFALRDMIADFFAGLAISVERPYHIGDWLEVGEGLVGRVTEINWRATRLVTQEQRTVVVPNSSLAGRQFINYSTPEPVYREAMEIVLDFSLGPARAENLLLSAILATEGLAKDRAHQVRIKGFIERGVVYEVRFWINDYADRASLRHRISANILRYLAQAGVSIPHDQQDVHLSRTKRLREDRRIEAHRLLSRVGWLELLSAEELRQLGEVARGREFSAGEAVVRQGEPGDSLFVLVEGLLDASVQRRPGESRHVGIIEPGEALGEMSLLTGARRAATVTAATQAFAFEVRREDLENILRARPELAGELGRVMALRLMDTKRATESAEEGDAEDAESRAGQIANRIRAFFGLDNKK